MMMIGGIIMAVSEDAKLSLIFVVVIPVLVGAIFFIGMKGLPLFKAIQIKLDKLNLVLREHLTGIRVIRSFNRIDHENRRFTEANRDLTDTAIKVNKIMAGLMPLMMIVMNFSMIAILYFGGIRIGDGDLQVGSLMAFIQYAMQIMFSLIMVSMMFVLIPRASASAVRINEVLDMRPEFTDPTESELHTTAQATKKMDAILCVVLLSLRMYLFPIQGQNSLHFRKLALVLVRVKLPQLSGVPDRVNLHCLA